MMNPRNAQRGFTLMELMVVIVIVAILAAVAVPLYINYVNDARNTEAKGAIGAITTAEQTWFQAHNTYIKVKFPAGVPDGAGFSCDLTEPSKNWDFEVTAGDAAGFTTTATGKTTGDYKDRSVTLTYSRAGTPTWDTK